MKRKHVNVEFCNNIFQSQGRRKINSVGLNYNGKYKISVTPCRYKWIMGDNRQISHTEEFQIIYIETASSRRWNLITTTSSEVWTSWSNCLLKSIICKGAVVKSDFIVDKPDKHCLSMKIKISTHSDITLIVHDHHMM